MFCRIFICLAFSLLTSLNKITYQEKDYQSKDDDQYQKLLLVKEIDFRQIKDQVIKKCKR
jgi:hypothetical protein